MEIEFWVIMDKSKKAIACGSPRNRSMKMMGGGKITRVLLYGSKSKAIAGFSGGNGFYDETYQAGDEPHPTYLRKTYGNFGRYENVCIPVKVRMVIDE
jgi:hypothetical protein